MLSGFTVGVTNEAGNVWEDQVAVFILVIDNEDETCERVNNVMRIVCCCLVLRVMRATFFWRFSPNLSNVHALATYLPPIFRHCFTFVCKVCNFLCDSECDESLLV